MASMRDVAELAGVSISTVSRVVNKTVSVDKETRRLVEEAIRATGYRPNLLATGLRSRSGKLIGLAVPEIAHHSFELFIQYTEEYVRANEYGLILGDTKNDPETEATFIDNLIRRSVDGIIFIRVSDESRALEMLDSTSIPYVVLDRGATSANAPTVVMDNVAAGKLAAKYLLSLGHRRCACLTGPLNVPLCRERLSGFVETIETAGIEYTQEWTFEGDFKFQTGVEMAKQVTKITPRVTAVWAQNDLMGIGLISGLFDQGWSVPADLSVVGVDDITTCRMIRPRLTTVRQPFQAMCKAAVDLLLRQRQVGNPVPERIVLPTELVIRESTAEPFG